MEQLRDRLSILQGVPTPDPDFAVVDELACWMLHSMAISGASLKETSFFFTKLESPYAS